jgi:hypothetical protein
MRQPLPVAQGKRMDMFRLSVKPRKVADKDVFHVSCVISRFTHFKFYLPSPFLLAIILVFLVLPLVWPE